MGDSAVSDKKKCISAIQDILYWVNMIFFKIRNAPSRVLKTLRQLFWSENGQQQILLCLFRACDLGHSRGVKCSTLIGQKVFVFHNST